VIATLLAGVGVAQGSSRSIAQVGYRHDARSIFAGRCRTPPDNVKPESLRILGSQTTRCREADASSTAFHLRRCRHFADVVSQRPPRHNRAASPPPTRRAIGRAGTNAAETFTIAAKFVAIGRRLASIRGNRCSSRNTNSAGPRRLDQSTRPSLSAHSRSGVGRIPEGCVQRAADRIVGSYRSILPDSRGGLIGTNIQNGNGR